MTSQINAKGEEEGEFFSDDDENVDDAMGQAPQQFGFGSNGAQQGGFNFGSANGAKSMDM